ncbi:ECs1072 family phage-associated protein [Morganella morganii]|nr:hypothetical protein [Morganella morganii]EKT0590847.1 hypothetical protein [Morganella morganii]EKW8485073.1 hypothetical protein [Morganella morganii]ELJ5774218.1 hypothetical protein [Morganella morganii]MBT0444805.1 hypothetical protein [Morganella morganii subsp. morganii]MCU6273327.1 hypothetical protein [Morganella morganii]
MSKYANLWQTIGSTLCKYHNVGPYSFEWNEPVSFSIRKKARFLFLLEIALYQHRDTETDIWYKQSPQETLYSFIYSKIGMLPEQFNELSNKAKLLVLQKPLSEFNLPEKARSFLEKLAMPSPADNFDIDPLEGWILGSGWIYLKMS